MNLLFQVENVPLSTSGSMSTTVSEKPEPALGKATGATAMGECKIHKVCHLLCLSSQIREIMMSHTSQKKYSFPGKTPSMSLFLRSH